MQVVCSVLMDLRQCLDPNYFRTKPLYRGTHLCCACPQDTTFWHLQTRILNVWRTEKPIHSCSAEFLHIKITCFAVTIEMPPSLLSQSKLATPLHLTTWYAAMATLIGTIDWPFLYRYLDRRLKICRKGQFLRETCYDCIRHILLMLFALGKKYQLNCYS